MVKDMSDPVTNAEVEDVLSSIRRLVSEERRPMQAHKTAPAPDRLVLTPALRVTDECESAAKDTPVENHLRSGDDAKDVMPETDSSAEPQDGPDWSDAVAQEKAADQDNDQASQVLDLTGHELENTTADQPEHEAAGSEGAIEPQVAKTASLSAKIEALEAAIGNISDTWEPDEPGKDDYSGTEAPAMKWEDDVDHDALGAPVGIDKDDDTAEATGAQAETWTQAETGIEEEPALAEAAASMPEHAMPDQDFDEDNFAFVSDAQDAEPDVDQGGVSKVDRNPDQFLDEAALRNLISEILRTELQGALGERITRNVRKLVRREINRALTAQDLE